MSTKARLAADLEAAGLSDMARHAREGYYDDYESPLDMPEHQLRADLIEHGRKDMAQQVIDGKWDGTKAESTAWFEREGKYLITPEVATALLGNRAQRRHKANPAPVMHRRRRGR